jgi:hypothetical protein
VVDPKGIPPFAVKFLTLVSVLSVSKRFMPARLAANTGIAVVKDV